MIQNLPTKNTWLLILLSIFTYFVYPAHYVKKLTARLNEEPSEAPPISTTLVWAILVLSYLSLALFVGYLAVEEDHPIARLSSIVDRICGLSFILWSFSARSRIHALLGSSKGSPQWLHGFWTFLFNVFYVNFKLARLKSPSV